MAARYVTVIDVPLPIEEAFDAIADFSRTESWDPGVKSAVCTTAEPIRAGSRFRLEVDLLGRTRTYGYAITDYERPSRLVLRGGDGATRLVDEITFVSRGRGTRITYEVRCRLVGLLRLAEPVVELGLMYVGRRASEGLRRYARTLALEGRASKRAPSRRTEVHVDVRPIDPNEAARDDTTRRNGFPHPHP